MSKTTFSIRGKSKQEVSVKAIKFIKQRSVTKDEDWIAEDPYEHETGLFNWKPWVVVLTRRG